MTGSTRLKCVLIFIFIADLSGMPKKTPYEFIYNVDDSLSGNDFGHWESSDGQVVHGQYHVLLPDGQRQTVEYTADAVNGYQAKTVTYTADVVNAYQAKVAVNTSTFQVADSIQQGVNQGKESNVVQVLTYDQDTEKPPKYLVCPWVMRNKYDECKALCKKLSCWWQEKRNFLYACLSGIIQDCTEITISPTTPEPKHTVKCGIEISDSNPGTPSYRRINSSDSDSNRDPPRIVNGVDVKPERKYSWQVGLKLKGSKDGAYDCGGSIITNRHILTAAHCAVITDKIYIGIADHSQLSIADNLPDFKEPILSKNIIIHEDYNNATKENDIAIIELSTPIDLEKHAEDIHPICLPADDSKTYAGLTATVSGWGSTVGYDYPDNFLPGFTQEFPDILQETRMPVLKNSICKRQVKNSLLGLFGLRIKDTNICAATEDFRGELTGDCQGDSGGPLSVKENEKHEQVGIVSFGLGCASQGNPSVYTRVSKYLPWIKIQVGSETIYTNV